MWSHLDNKYKQLASGCPILWHAKHFDLTSWDVCKIMLMEIEETTFPAIDLKALL